MTNLREDGKTVYVKVKANIGITTVITTKAFGPETKRRAEAPLEWKPAMCTTVNGATARNTG